MARPNLFLPAKFFFMLFVILCKLPICHLYQRSEPFWINDNVSQARLLRFSKAFQMLLVVCQQIGITHLHLRDKLRRIGTYIFDVHLLFVVDEGLFYLGLCYL